MKLWVNFMGPPADGGEGAAGDRPKGNLGATTEGGKSKPPPGWAGVRPRSLPATHPAEAGGEKKGGDGVPALRTIRQIRLRVIYP